VLHVIFRVPHGARGSVPVHAGGVPRAFLAPGVEADAGGALAGWYRGTSPTPGVPGLPRGPGERIRVPHGERGSVPVHAGGVPRVFLTPGAQTDVGGALAGWYRGTSPTPGVPGLPRGPGEWIRVPHGARGSVPVNTGGVPRVFLTPGAETDAGGALAGWYRGTSPTPGVPGLPRGPGERIRVPTQTVHHMP
jgi:hypothetical protein